MSKLCKKIFDEKTVEVLEEKIGMQKNKLFQLELLQERIYRTIDGIYKNHCLELERLKKLLEKVKKRGNALRTSKLAELHKKEKRI